MTIGVLASIYVSSVYLGKFLVTGAGYTFSSSISIAPLLHEPPCRASKDIILRVTMSDTNFAQVEASAILTPGLWHDHLDMLPATMEPNKFHEF